MEYWYGWIPILTNSLSFEKVIADLKKFQVIQKLDDKDFLLDSKNDKRFIRRFKKGLKEILDNQVRASLKQEVGIKKDEDAFYFIRNFDDPDTSKLKLIIFGLADFHISRVGIFDFPYIEKDKIGLVDGISEKGLVKYHLVFHRKMKIAEKESSKQFFGIIRDIYHEHIYAAQTDFALFPVLAKDDTIAIDEIYKQFQNKIIDYHKLIRKLLNILSGRKIIISHRNIPDTLEIISDAKGEMVYAQNFIHLFSLPKEKAFSIENAAESFEILSQKVNNLSSIEVNRINVRIFLLTILFVGVTAYFGLRQISYNILNSFLLSFFIVLIVSSIILIFEWFSSVQKGRRQ